MIRILDSNFNNLGVIKNAIKSTRLEAINGENILDFEAVLDSKLNSLIDENTVFELYDDYFDIAFFKKNANDDTTNTVEVEAEHVSYRLNNPLYNVEYFTETGTPTYVLGKILEGTGFTAGTIEYTNVVTYSAQEPKSRRQLLMEFITSLDSEVSFSKFVVNIVTHRGSTAIKPALKDRNVKVVSKTVNKRELDGNGNPITSYSCTPIYLPGTTYALGDDILLMQKELGIGEPLRVVQLSFNPYDNMDTTFVFANYLNGLENSIYRIVTTSVTKDKIYNGCRIGPEYGFEAIRSDKKARAFFRSDGMKFQKGDGTGNNWTDTLYVDVDGNLILNGSISWGNISDPPSIKEILAQPGIPGEGDEDKYWFDTDGEPGVDINLAALAAVESTYIDEHGVWTPNVYATNISVLNGQIVDAQIGDLSASKITAGTINITQEINIADEDSTIVIDSDGITVTDGKFSLSSVNNSVVINGDGITVKNTTGTASVFDEYGLDMRVVDFFKNLVKNSQFEIFDISNVPIYWTGTGTSSSGSSFYGTYSLRLASGEYMIQSTTAAISPNWFDRDMCRVSFHRKYGSIKLEVYDVTNDSYYTLTAEDGTIGTSITFARITNWQNSGVSVKFNPDETGHGTCVSFKIKLTNVHASETGYIDAVMCTPDFTGMRPQAYKDGPESQSFDSQYLIGDFTEIYIGNSEPADTSKLWYDTSE